MRHGNFEDKNMPKSIVIQGISKRFDKSTQALNNLDLIIPTGKIFGILGPNGAGKSTLLRVIANFLEPDSGKIQYGDIEITHNKPWAKNHIRYCPQQPVVYDYLTVKENLELFSELYDIPSSEYHSRINSLLESLNMETKRNARAKTLSGGQKKRLSLMISLLTQPLNSILLLDEPIAGLDISSRRVIREYILNLKAKNITIILSTHDFLETQKLCDEIAILNQGKLIISGPPEEIIKSKGQNNSFLEVKTDDPHTLLEKIKVLSKDLDEIQSYELLSSKENCIQIRITGDMESTKEVQRSILSLGEKITQIILRDVSLEDVFLSLIKTPLMNNQKNQNGRK